MLKAYWIGRVDVADAEQYKRCIAANAAAFKKYGRAFLVRAGQYQNPEGTSWKAMDEPLRSIVDSRSAALDAASVSPGHRSN